MNYRDFEDFIENRMRMSHVYQPVMLMTLLRGGGKASTTKIVKAILDLCFARIKSAFEMNNV
jgi:ATP adenylyltransferase